MTNRNKKIHVWQVLIWKKTIGVYLIYALGLLCMVQSSFSCSEYQQIPYCQTEKAYNSASSRSTIVVSTLDGSLTALDTLTGLVLWSQTTDPGPLLESTISEFKFLNQGKSVQLVPSLDGDLYTFDGEHMGGTPISAENLLSNTMKMSDGIIMTGGKETKTYGINIKTGQILYKCGMEACKYSGSAINDGDVLVVRRMTKTVRAVSSFSGIERWNYSVGHHDLNLAVPFDSGSCEAGTNHHEPFSGAHPDVKFASGEGFMIVRNVGENRKESWDHEFGSPIVRAWHIDKSELTILDVIENNYYDSFHANQSNSISPIPIIYLGSYNNQFYILQSHGALNAMVLEWKSFGGDFRFAPPLVTYQPYLSTALSRTPIIHSNYPGDTSVVIHPKGDGTNTAIVQAVGDYPFDNGMYFIITPITNATPDEIIVPYKESEGHDDESIIGSLWYWWKEILLMSITFAILINVFITRHHINRIRLRIENETSNQQKIVVIETVPVASDPCQSSIEMSKSNSSDASDMMTPPAEFISRYFDDFEPVQILGKGGFGVVFEARNKIDDCHYAIKRISMSNKNDSKERIMREVKALAKLDHMGIVRYYNSWLESPPVNWKQPVDLVNASNVCTPSSTFNAKYLHNSFATLENPSKTDFIYDTKETVSNEECITQSNNNVSDKSMQNFNHNGHGLSHFYEECGGDRLITSSKSHLMDSGVIFHASEVSSRLDNQKFQNSDCRFRSTSLPISSGREFESSVNSSCDSFIQFKEATGASIKTNQRDAQSMKRSNSGLLIETDIQSDSFAWPKCKSYLYIQMQLCRKESLKDWLHRHTDDRDKFEILGYFYQIVSAVEYVHEQGLMHRDLKPSNIFFAMDGAIKIGDFGLVAAMSSSDEINSTDCLEDQPDDVNQKHTNQVGTKLYMSPEQLAETTYDYKVDIFSLGLILFELLVPFSTEMERIQVMTAARDRKFPNGFITEFSNEYHLVNHMLSHRSKDRPCATEIKQNELLQDFHPRPSYLRHQRSRSMSRTYSTSSSNSSGNSGIGVASDWLGS